MKKCIYIVISLILFSCSKGDDFAENPESIVVQNEISAKNSEPVRLIKSWRSSGSYRGYTSYNSKFTVRIEDLAFDKSVSIFHEKINGDWEEIPLSYSFDIDGAYEIWTGTNNQGGYGISNVYADEFVVKYVVNGTTYWDNNEGTNYVVPFSNDGYFFADATTNISVDTDFDSVFYSPSNDQNQFNVTVDVKNLSPTKEIEVVYTTDGWQTKQYFPLRYRSIWNSGPLLYVNNPNQFGIERWSGFVLLDKSLNEVEYAVVYRVNGQEHWDNNYGKNYKVNIPNLN